MKLIIQRPAAALFTLLTTYLYVESSVALISSETTGVEIMQQVQTRHQQFPYIYEEQSMVMQDRHGDSRD